MAIDKSTIEKFIKAGKQEIVFATKEQNIKEHWNVKIGDLKFSIKGLKKINRIDSKVNEDIHWLEIKGVQDEGWIYGGSSDRFVFETFDYWVVVEKSKLKELIVKKIKKEMVLKPEDALYKLYRRNGRKDLITLVKTIDLMSVADKIINKI